MTAADLYGLPNIPDLVLAEKALDRGWKLQRTSCSCGECTYAWLKPRPSGAMEMVGCSGHVNLGGALYDFDEKTVAEIHEE